MSFNLRVHALGRESIKTLPLQGSREMMLKTEVLAVANSCRSSTPLTVQYFLPVDAIGLYL